MKKKCKHCGKFNDYELDMVIHCDTVRALEMFIIIKKAIDKTLLASAPDLNYPLLEKLKSNK